MSKDIYRVGKGHEHKVVADKKDPGYVYKYPRFGQILTLPRYRGASVIREELTIAEKRAEGTGVIIPETQVFPAGPRRYIIKQARIDDDKSVDIGNYLDEHGNHYLRLRYEANPDNFRSFQENVYWLDPTLGRASRIMEKHGYNHEILFERGNEVRRKVKTIKSKLKIRRNSNSQNKNS